MFQSGARQGKIVSTPSLCEWKATYRIWSSSGRL